MDYDTPAGPEKTGCGRVVLMPETDGDQQSGGKAERGDADQKPGFGRNGDGFGSRGRDIPVLPLSPLHEIAVLSGLKAVISGRIPEFHAVLRRI